MPSRRSPSRRAASFARSDMEEDDVLTQLADSSPNVNNALPAVPVKQSWAYGSEGSPLSARKLKTASRQRLEELAEHLDVPDKSRKGRKTDVEKDLSNSNGNEPIAHSWARSRSTSVSPIRKSSMREPTPDQVQLLQALNDVTSRTSTPVKQAAPPAERITDNLTFPIPRILSAKSSPAAPPTFHPSVQAITSNLRLGASPGLRFAPVTHHDVAQVKTPPNVDSFDTESTISWILEREIHHDDLQRTRPSKYRDSPRGKNISKPPRRASGLAFTREPIIEEDDRAVAVDSDSVDGNKEAPEPASEENDVLGSQNGSRGQEHMDLEYSSAPAKTVISQRVRSGFSLDKTKRPLSSESSSAEPRLIPGLRRAFPTVAKYLRVTGAILLAIFACFAVYHSRGSVLETLSGAFSPPFNEQPHSVPSIPSVSSISSRVTSLSTGSGRPYVSNALDARVSALSRQIEMLQSKVNDFAAQPPVAVVKPLPAHTEPARINFLSIGSGAIVDPYITNPAVGRKLSLWQSMLSFVIGRPRQPNPPVVAMIPWEDMGDCWCSPPRDGMWQLAIMLGRPIVPEEVVVEHIPKGATMDPGAAPRQIELWVQYKINTKDEVTTQSAKSVASGFLPQDGPQSQSSEHTTEISRSAGGFTLHEVVMETLRIAYKNEPESAYLDEISGSLFYRIGKCEYDINAENNVQSFILDAIIDDPAIRVEKVIFRIRSNWGAPHMCLYRVKLHGHR